MNSYTTSGGEKSRGNYVFLCGRPPEGQLALQDLQKCEDCGAEFMFPHDRIRGGEILAELAGGPGVRFICMKCREGYEQPVNLMTHDLTQEPAPDFRKRGRRK